MIQKATDIQKTAAKAKIGCCGFTVSQAEYFRLFQLIEIQQTFYQLPQLKTAERWQQSAPQGFEFTMKAWQLITHEPTSPTYRRLREKIEPSRAACYGSFRSTDEVIEAWRRTAQFARSLGAGIILFQCPASFEPNRENIANMQKFFTTIDRQGFCLAWEPRGAAWSSELIFELCRNLDLIHCVDPFKDKPQYGNFHYFRLHGISGYTYRYTDQDLQTLIAWVREKPTYVLFNNQWMKENALRFMELIEQQGASC